MHKYQYIHSLNCASISKLTVLVEEYYMALLAGSPNEHKFFQDGNEIKLDTTGDDDLIHSRILIDKYCKIVLESNYYANC